MPQQEEVLHFDCIVIGLGSMGCSAAYHLAASGVSVVGIEQFSIPHNKGAHSGQTRIIRKAYFEHPDYIPLLQRAYENWALLEKQSGEKLYYRTGLLYAAPAGHELLEQIKTAASLYDVPLDHYTVAALKEKYPQFQLPETFNVLIEPDAGFLAVEKSIRAYASAAEERGAILHTGEKVISWHKTNEGVEVITDKAIYHSSKLVITSGPWSAALVPGITDRLRITRQVLSWLQPLHPDRFTTDQFPCWMIATAGMQGSYYGFPAIRKEELDSPAGIKVALHYPGDSTTPDQIDRTVHAADTDPLIEFTKSYIPDGYAQLNETATCMYSNSPDEHFIIDHLPGDPDVAVAWGFSGHGFKFVSVVGEILADLVISGKTTLPVDFLRATRF